MMGNKTEGLPVCLEKNPCVIGGAQVRGGRCDLLENPVDIGWRF
jgi:hypothetical protein